MNTVIRILLLLLVTQSIHAQKMNDRKTSNGLLAGGIASCALGTGSLFVVAYDRTPAPLQPAKTPLLIAGLGLNLVAMPVCFVVRDVLAKRAKRRDEAVRSKLTNP